MAAVTSLDDAQARVALKADLARFSCQVSQPDDPPLFTREPQPDMQSRHWRGSDLMPLLERLGRDVQLAADSPRRTLRLHDPALPYGTTTTLWGSIQVIMPGEVATAHRHSANAFRFVMQGRGAWTTVDGESCAMLEHDLLLTPSGSWHDHTHKGDEPMIWLDVLDISLMRSLRASFFEGLGSPVQAIADVPDLSLRQYGSGLMAPPGAQAQRGDGRNPLRLYSASMARSALAQAAGLPSDAVDDTVLEYRHPLTGGSALQTMSMQLQQLRPGFEGQERRQTGSKLYYVVEGAGTTFAGSSRFDWQAGDFFTVAPWQWHRHVNASGRNATLFQVNDSPVFRALGYYREEARRAEVRP